MSRCLRSSQGLGAHRKADALAALLADLELTAGRRFAAVAAAAVGAEQGGAKSGCPACSHVRQASTLASEPPVPDPTGAVSLVQLSACTCMSRAYNMREEKQHLMHGDMQLRLALTPIRGNLQASGSTK